MKNRLKCIKTLTGSILSLAFVLGAVPFMGTEVKADDGVYKWDFEDGFEDWISIDADGDGCDWFRYGTSDVYADNDNPEYYVHTGNDSIMSRSYEKEKNKVLDPDNWLISPKVPLGGYISFYANAVDDSYPDHIGVFVTTGERDNLESYVLVDDWDLEDWSTGNEVASSVWEQYTVSLEEFEGEGYVAIRHFNSSDKFVLAVDDVEIGGPLDDIEAVISGFEGVYDGEQHGITVDVTSPDSYEIRYGTEEGSCIFDESPEYIVPGTYTVYYRITAEGYMPLQGSETIVIEETTGMIYQDFEDDLDDWTLIDRDNDGENWFQSSIQENNNLLASLSQNYGGEGLDPDNWAISPAVKLGGSVSFYGRNVISGYADHIGVYVTTGDIDDLDSYELIDDFVPPSEWTYYTFDLSDYSGEGYIAIRHYDSSNQYAALIDDIVILPGQMEEIEAEISGFEGVYDGEQHGITVDVTSPDSYEIRYGTEEGSYLLAETPKYVVPGTYTVYYSITAEGYLPLQGSETIVIEEISGMIYQDFEDNIDGWTLIDRDEDGEGWEQTSFYGCGLLASISYRDDKVFYPDNWFISPAVQLGGTFSFYGKSYDPSYLEHIGVFVTTGDIDDLDSYELIEDFILPGEWTSYSFDLSDYSGEGYIAIRHYDSEDEFIALIDDLALIPGQAAPEGWVQEGDLWFYFEDGEAVTGWKQVDGVWYFFGEDGSMTKGWYQEGSSWYYFKSSGAMAKGWTKVGNNWYYFTSSGKMKTGWLQDGSKWYYLKSSGAMATGWTKVSGKWYFMGTDGVMKTGWVQDAGKWYYMDSNGTMHTGWLQIGAKWYYLNSSGVMVTGTQTINGKTYTFNSSGVWIK